MHNREMGSRFLCEPISLKMQATKCATFFENTARISWLARKAFVRLSSIYPSAALGEALSWQSAGRIHITAYAPRIYDPSGSRYR